VQYPRMADNLSGVPALTAGNVAFLSWPLLERKLAARCGIEPQKPERIESLDNSKRAHLLPPHPRCFIRRRSTIRSPFHTVFPSRKLVEVAGIEPCIAPRRQPQLGPLVRTLNPSTWDGASITAQCRTCRS
jgi:hypothetical protein